MLENMLLSIMEEAGTAVMILAENVERHEFFASRLTRNEVQRQLLIIAGAVDKVMPTLRQQMPELEWDGWDKVGRELGLARPPFLAATDELVWFALRSLVPATLIWLKVYRQNQPELFAFHV